MNRIAILIFILITTISVYGQNALQEGHNCFKKGDYNCALTKYDEAIKLASGIDKEIIQINIESAQSCANYVKTADEAFLNKNYTNAKQNYQNILDINPNDTYAKSQIERCNNFLNPTLSVSKESLSFSLEGGSEYISISTNVSSYSISGLPSWCTVDKYNDYFIIKCNQNHSNTPRSDYFIISAGGKTQRINITQSGRTSVETTLSVSREYLSIDANGGTSIINVNTNSNNYQISNLPTWCRVKSKHFNWFSLECDENKGTQPLSDWFMITAGNKQVKINIHQSGKTGRTTSQKARSFSSKKKDKANKQKKSSYNSFFAIGYEGGEIANYGFRLEFGGTRTVGMFLNARSSLISDNEILNSHEFIENKNEAIIGLNFKLVRELYLNLGGGYGFYKERVIDNQLEEIEYYPTYGGITLRLGKRFNLSGGVSFMDIEENFNSNKLDPEFTIGFTINLRK